MNNLAVYLSNLSHYYGKTNALNAVSLQIPQGRTVGLIGPDGVGKSTLLSLIAGVKLIQQGEVEVFGLDMAEKQARGSLSHRIAFMPQGLGKNLYLTLSIYDNVDFHARLFGLSSTQRQARIERLLKATGLLPFADRPAGKLSGGMKQKLSLCCALIHQPDLLILDEPTTGVDPLSRRQFWQLVKDLRVESPQMTVIVATAYIDEAESFEYVLAMDNGKLIADSPTQQLIRETHSENLEQAYVKLLPSEKRSNVDLEIPPFVQAPNEESVIVAQGLTKKFDDFVSVDNVSFIIPRGEIFGFLGSNGCGKSTTMKMLTGLLDPTEGSATLLGQPIDASDINTRKRVGYMSQAFSLYEELTVKENLTLHAKLFQIPKPSWVEYVNNAMTQFHLNELANKKPSDLPLGIRQRLQLAAACLHKPEVLILDEPTSGVDPAARDMFWQYLIKLSREDKITIFVTTHFMNEASRCDRVSLMHCGRVLAVGTPEELRLIKQAPTLEEAFIRYLEEQINDITQPIRDEIQQEAEIQPQQVDRSNSNFASRFSMIWTFAAREGKELLRDNIRLFFALCGPVIMLLAMASSISFDLHPAKLSVLDHDNSQESRQLIEAFEGSRYFIRQTDLISPDEINPTLQTRTAKVVLEIPANFGRELLRLQRPEIAIFIDGAFPASAEHLNGSVQGVLSQYMQELLQKNGINYPMTNVTEPRMVYNQDFKSIFAMTPSIVMLAMMMIPAMMTALSVVREKEIGSIMNLYGSPASKFQFLLGKQLPYVATAFVSYLILITVSITVFGVPIKGSIPAMLFGMLLGILASTGFGLLVSSFVKSQVAAIFATAILIIIPTINFSGMLAPTSTLNGGVLVISKIFPSSWAQLISLGGFTKGLGFPDMLQSYLALLIIYLSYLSLAVILLKKQEK
ncbi:multidrug ABC transporter ATP-binding protein [Pasteurellaceae bacterium 15-036681]|nr:multidrug ABC transporter ATP-binding protein [Pasteurellaceae bacterium 15-036681]